MTVLAALARVVTHLGLAATIQATYNEPYEVARQFATQFGSPATVAKGLRVLQGATGADEILVTTITHDHADRVRSFELLAQEWGRPEPDPIPRGASHGPQPRKWCGATQSTISHDVYSDH
jgi:alkanesulfonate monooxygenase SsuD/methylene tetrahydromethanopterin reductase-like flavin-dependent oxidoreductase (luciferase family)